MTTPTLTRQRNLSLECCKLLASWFVVFIHVLFPGPAGDFVRCLARFGVPMFFAISGWYSFGAAAPKLARRLGHVLLLELAGIGIMQLWGIFAALYTGRDVPSMLLESLPTMEQMKMWLLFNEDPFSGQLWYLSSSALCYILFWFYTRLGGCRLGYRPLYILGGLLLCGHFAMGELSEYTGLSVFLIHYRNGIFFGFPMFLMGLFLREHRDTLLSKLKTGQLVLLLVCGLGLSIAEWKFFDTCDLYLGNLVNVSALMLLTCRYPQVPRPLEGIAAACGSISTVIYLVHLAVHDIYLGFFHWRVAQYSEIIEPWLRPLVVAALSTAAGIGWQIVLLLWKKLRRKG